MTSVGMAVLIEVVNVVLYLAIFQLTEMECRITLTGKMMARMVRNIFFFFFNTTLIPFFLFLLDWIGADRLLIYDYIVSLFFVTNVISPLSPILNPLHLYKLYCRRKMVKEGTSGAIKGRTAYSHSYRPTRLSNRTIFSWR